MRRSLKVFKRYLQRLGRAEDTITMSVYVVRQFLEHTGRAAGRTTKRDVAEYLAAMEALAPSTRARRLDVLKSYCKAMVEAGTLKSDPCAGFKARHQKPPPGLVVSVEDVKRLLDAALQGPTPEGPWATATPSRNASPPGRLEPPGTWRVEPAAATL